VIFRGESLFGVKNGVGSFVLSWSSHAFLNEKSDFLFEWLLCVHESSTIKSIIIVPPCLVWVLCVKELSGWRKSRRLHHGGTLLFLQRKLRAMYLNIHVCIKVHLRQRVELYSKKNVTAAWGMEWLRWKMQPIRSEKNLQLQMVNYLIASHFTYDFRK